MKYIRLQSVVEANFPIITIAILKTHQVATDRDPTHLSQL